jgi:hypothetical protein
MNCNCIIDIEKQLKDMHEKHLGTQVEVECQNYGLTFGKSVRTEHITEFKVTADAKGYKKGKLTSVFASFCPFCGKSTREEQPMEEQAHG